MKKLISVTLVVLFVLLPVFETVHAEAQTPMLNTRYRSKNVTYRSVTKIKFYNEVWNKGAQEWRKTKVISIKKKQSKKSKLTIDAKTEASNWLGLTFHTVNTNNNYIVSSKLYLNRYHHIKNAKFYNKKMYIGAAIHEYGHAMGLAHNTKNKKSVMFPNPTKALPTKVPNVDKKAMKKRYAKAPKKGVHPFSERMHANWIKEYPNLKSLQKASPIIVDGYVTSSQTVKGSIPKTKHTFQIEKIRRGANKLTSRKISIKQLGTKKVALEESMLLSKKQKVRLFLKQDPQNKKAYILINEGDSLFLPQQKGKVYKQVSSGKLYAATKLK